MRGEVNGGYIWNDGRGVTATFPMTRGEDGVWSTDPADPALADFAGFDHTAYMFRITKDNGSVAYRTDLYSRCQIGNGKVNPDGTPPPAAGRGAAGGRTWMASRAAPIVVDPDRTSRAVDAGARCAGPAGVAGNTVAERC
ncbi:MAG: hypothetical protein U1E33_03730 [Rhodospirillales bacterium]